MNIFIRLLYAILIAAAVVTFVSVGIWSFYPGPKTPECLRTPSIAQKVDGPSQDEQQKCDEEIKQYDKDTQAYNRTISIIGTVLAAGIVVGGLYIRRRSDIIGEGLSLGGIATSVYGVTTAVIAEDRIMRFVAVTVFLASAIVIVYVQFNERNELKPAAKKTK